MFHSTCHSLRHLACHCFASAISSTSISLTARQWLRLTVFTGTLLLAMNVGNAQTSQGYASWYGPGFYNRLTANGEVYDAWEMTAAHLTLPFDTRVRVTNLENGRRVTVRINDRGPYIDNRIIDLSEGAAETLGMLHSGIVPVRVEVLGVRDVNASQQDTQQALADAQATARDIDRAMYHTRMVNHLEDYNVVSAEHQEGELLVLRSEAYDSLIIVRVAEQTALEHSDLLVSDLLYQKLGNQVFVVTETN